MIEELKIIMETLGVATGAAKQFGILWLSIELVKVVFAYAIGGALIFVAAKLLGKLVAIVQEQAREVLPNSLKTEIVTTANLREWRHIFKLRTSKAAHPQIRDLMKSCLNGFKLAVPVIFDDINP